MGEVLDRLGSDVVEGAGRALSGCSGGFGVDEGDTAALGDDEVGDFGAEVSAKQKVCDRPPGLRAGSIQGPLWVWTCRRGSARAGAEAGRLVQVL